MKKLVIVLLFTGLFLLSGSTPENRNKVNVPLDTTKTSVGTDLFLNQNDPWVESILSKMSIEEKAGQMIYPAANGKYMSVKSPEYRRLQHLVKNLKVGGIIFFLSNIYDQAILTNKLQEAADIPLLIAADFERGVAQRAADATLFPYNMGIGAADDSLLTYQMGRIVAKEGRAIGVHQNYAPVADVNNNPLNPIINVRSFGDDVALVTKLSNAFLKGVQDGGMIATSKHFPGHGNTNVDSHRSLPVIDGTKEELKKVELAPFQSNIESGVMSFMIGHLDVPSYDENKIPSSLSKNIVTDLLKNEMKFKGLVVTDAMEMHAITSNYSETEATVKAVLAGNDMILAMRNVEEALNSIIMAVKKGIISEARLDESVRKILLAKKWAGLDKNKFIDADKIADIVGSEEHNNLAKKLAAKSVTLVKDDAGIIPLDKNLKYAHISINDSRFGGEENYFNKLLKNRAAGVAVHTLSLKSSDKDYKEALQSSKDAEMIILSTYLKVRAYEGDLGLTEEQRKLVNEILNLNKPVVFASHGNPYILSLFPEAKTYICNYGDAEVSEEALAEALFGESGISGKLPTSIPGTNYTFGSGIMLPKTTLRNLSIDYSEDQEKFAEVDKIIQDAIKDTAFPGVVLLIAKDGDILHHRAFGWHTYDIESRPVTVNTIFDMASVSKVVATTTAAMICIDKKLFSLDDKVAKYIPEFVANGKGNITIRNLLVHNAGLTAWKKFYEIYTNPDDVLKDIYSSKLEFETGSKMVYSDLGMITLAKIIERVTGKTLDQFCRSEIFIPLEMRNTMYNPPAEIKYLVAPTEFDNYWRHRQLIGEVHDEASSLLNGVAGHAGLFSTTKDLSNFLQMLLQKGMYRTKQIVKPETVELFTKRQSEQSSRGLGWDTKSPGSSAGELFTNLSYGHTGYTGTSVWTDPARNLFVILLTNRVYPTRNNTKILKLRPKIHDAVIRALQY